MAREVFTKDENGEYGRVRLDCRCGRRPLDPCPVEVEANQLGIQVTKDTTTPWNPKLYVKEVGTEKVTPVNMKPLQLNTLVQVLCDSCCHGEQWRANMTARQKGA